MTICQLNAVQMNAEQPEDL